MKLGSNILGLVTSPLEVGEHLFKVGGVLPEWEVSAFSRGSLEPLSGMETSLIEGVPEALDRVGRNPAPLPRKRLSEATLEKLLPVFSIVFPEEGEGIVLGVVGPTPGVEISGLRYCPF